MNEEPSDEDMLKPCTNCGYVWGVHRYPDNRCPKPRGVYGRWTGWSETDTWKID